jgi:nitrogen fixation/metabolism regulation signal transduction histidine kinase
MVATALLLAYLVGWTRFYEVWVIVGFALFYQIVALVRYGEKTARDLTRFLASIRHADFSMGFVEDERGPVFKQLNEAFADVTEAFKRVRAEREAQYRYVQHVAQHVGVALLAFRAEGDVEFVNAAARRLLGVGRLRTVQELVSVGASLASTLLQLPSGEQTIVRLEREGRLLQLAVQANRFQLGDERHVLISLQDIGNALEEQEMEAWQKLTRVLTHEIMNSVAPIASLASTAHHLLQENGEGDGATPLQDAREAVRIIEQRSEALIHFVDTYRSFAKIPAPHFALIPVADVLAGVRRLFDAELRGKGIACAVSVEPETLRLTADPELIEQVLINLLLNAIQAVEGAAGARISLQARPDAGGIAMIQVGDNGPAPLRGGARAHLRPVLYDQRRRIGHRLEPFSPDHAVARRHPLRAVRAGTRGRVYAPVLSTVTEKKRDGIL